MNENKSDKAYTDFVPHSEVAQAERDVEVARKNRKKYIRMAIQYGAILAIILAVVWGYIFPKSYAPNTAAVATTADSTSGGVNQTLKTASADGTASGNGFIAISYSGVAGYENAESTIVSIKSFKEQMDALAACGYVTISQQDIVNYYMYGTPLPKKALFLMFEDGIRETTTLVQDTLEKHNYLATINTYASNFDDVGSNFCTVSDLKTLLANSYWELGVNGYRLSYINVFDRYGNYYGHLNSDEYVNIHEFLVRDYNHYLMDFLRDEDRLRQETVEEMQNRIRDDYEYMRVIYTENFGYLPAAYVLMHSNTGMFGTDATVSAQNRIYITSLFGMNFNRQGTCFNTANSSIYDLSRMQPQVYWFTNHLLMRIWDDTGDDVIFVHGDENELQKWYNDEGAVEFKNYNQIVLTSEPYAYGRMALKGQLFADVNVSVTMDGNKCGHQAIYLRTDRNHENGVRVAISNNVLTVADLNGGAESELYSLDLFEFDGGSTKSVAEDELEGLITLNQMIVDYDEDQTRRDEAAAELERLKQRRAATMAEGSEGYVPTIDLLDRASRKVELKLEGAYLTVLIDGRIAVENLRVSNVQRGTVLLESSPIISTEFSQRNLYDDVYDAVFTNLVISEINDPSKIYYAYRPNAWESTGAFFTNLWENVTSFFINNF